MHTRFVLIHTSHAGNVGAVARAMKTMGFDDLVLVAPRWANVLRREETIQRASGAVDVLKKCRIVDTLDEAFDGITHLCATAMTARDFGPPTCEPRPYFDLLLKNEQMNQAKQVLNELSTSSLGGKRVLPQGVAFLFGSERFGMTNEDVYRCHVCLSIPSNPHFGSLNISAAVQLIAYEWRQALGGFAPANPAQLDSTELLNAQKPHRKSAPLADARELSGLLTHLEQALLAIGFLDPQTPKKLIPRLNQLFNRAALMQEEVHLLRGIAKATVRMAARQSMCHTNALGHPKHSDATDPPPHL